MFSLRILRFLRSTSSCYARAICSADRSVSATNVSVPFVQPPVGMVGYVASRQHQEHERQELREA